MGKKKAERGFINGTYVVADVPEDNLVLDGGQFVYSDGTQQAKAFSAYFELADVLDDTAAAADHVEIVLNGDDDVTTGIQDNKRETINNKYCYDLQGRKIENGKFVNRKSAKGVYIVNGNKVIR